MSAPDSDRLTGALVFAAVVFAGSAGLLALAGAVLALLDYAARAAGAVAAAGIGGGITLTIRRGKK